MPLLLGVHRPSMRAEAATSAAWLHCHCYCYCYYLFFSSSPGNARSPGICPAFLSELPAQACPGFLLRTRHPPGQCLPGVSEYSGSGSGQGVHLQKQQKKACGQTCALMGPQCCRLHPWQHVSPPDTGELQAEVILGRSPDPGPLLLTAFNQKTLLQQRTCVGRAGCPLLGRLILGSVLPAPQAGSGHTREAASCRFSHHVMPLYLISKTEFLTHPCFQLNATCRYPWLTLKNGHYVCCGCQ